MDFVGIHFFYFSTLALHYGRRASYSQNSIIIIHSHCCLRWLVSKAKLQIQRNDLIQLYFRALPLFVKSLKTNSSALSYCNILSGSILLGFGFLTIYPFILFFFYF